MSVTFDIDPSVSRIKNENLKLAHYMQTKLLSIDIYDADSHFLYAVAKLPMYDFLRQGAPFMTRAKKVELMSPDSSEFRGEIKLIIDNQGHEERERLVNVVQEDQNSIGYNKAARAVQPTQMRGKKIIRSKPMEANKVQ